MEKLSVQSLDVAGEADFATLLEESFAVSDPKRGEIVSGTVLAVDNYGLIVDVNLKRDAVVPRHDLDQLSDTPNYEIGQEVNVMIVNMEDADGNLVASITQARQSEDWIKAEALMESEEVWEGTVTEANRGGLIVPFGNLRGFVPASHVMDLPRGLSEHERQEYMSKLIGSRLAVKVIEVNRRRRRLVLSQREAQAAHRAQRKETLLEELQEGEVRHGVVSGLRDFGAFVDLGGADGLIHISELAWHRVRHPRELLSVGDEIEVYILRLDKEGKRIGLSLKRLQPNPWALVDDLYHIGQLVEGEISRVTQFGAFVSLEPGIEALLHTSQMADPPPDDPNLIVGEGETRLMRVISIESHRQRLGLSLKEVAPEELAAWETQRAELAAAEAEAEEAAEDGETAPATAEAQAGAGDEPAEIEPDDESEAIAQPEASAQATGEPTEAAQTVTREVIAAEPTADSGGEADDTVQSVATV